MSFSHWLTAIAVGALPFAAMAQQNQVPSHPIDVSAPASDFTYESAFKNYRSATEPAQTPDKLWRAANDEVGRLAGHVGHIKASPTPPASKQLPSSAQDAAPVDHSKHH